MKLDARLPWRVEWICYPSGYHDHRQFLNRESAEKYFAEALADREWLETLHSIALQFVDFVSPGACFVHSVKIYRNDPENERRVARAVQIR